MKSFIAILIGVIGITLFIYSLRPLFDGIQDEAMEKAYFEGQKDAIEHDIRIAKTPRYVKLVNGDSTYVDSCWIWVKSPWNSGREPSYSPSTICK